MAGLKRFLPDCTKSKVESKVKSKVESKVKSKVESKVESKATDFRRRPRF